MTSTSLEHTLEQLDAVLDDARSTGSPIGVFPAMYRSVTGAVQRAVRTGGLFDADDAVEHLTVVFADLYLGALRAHQRGTTTPSCWHEAFTVAEGRRRRMILQHLLLGMNAHINLDLGVASVTAGGPHLAALWADFVRVNEILFQILDRIQGRLGDVSPRISLIDRLGGPLDEKFMRFGIRTARDLAWHFAEHLAEEDHASARRDAAIAERDREVALLGRSITRPWSPIDLVGRAVAAAEVREASRVIDALSTVVADLDDVAARSALAPDGPQTPNRPLRTSRLLRH